MDIVGYDEFVSIMELHALWLEDETQGKRADISNRMLSVTLFDADDPYVYNMSKAIMRHTVFHFGSSLLSKMNLTGADMRNAYLENVNLCKADLTDADLSDADLDYADLSDSILEGANLTGASLFNTNLSGVNLIGAKLDSFNIPVVPDLDREMYEAIAKDPALFNMGNWHGKIDQCKTTHCRAGWAIHLAGMRGYELEKMYGSSVAGALIYAVSVPNRPVPDFHASTSDAWEFIKADNGESQ